MTRPSQVYPEHPRERILAHITSCMFKPVAFRRPQQGEFYLSKGGYQIDVHDTTQLSDPPERIICVREA